MLALPFQKLVNYLIKALLQNVFLDLGRYILNLFKYLKNKNLVLKHFGKEIVPLLVFSKLFSSHLLRMSQSFFSEIYLEKITKVFSGSCILTVASFTSSCAFKISFFLFAMPKTRSLRTRAYCRAVCRQNKTFETCNAVAIEIRDQKG